MEEIVKIEYSYSKLGMELKLDIDINENKIFIVKNNLINEKKIDEDKMKLIVENIINKSMYWKEMNIKNNIIDGFECILRIYTSEKIIEKYFKNVIPPNMNEFNKVIEEVLK